MSTQLLDRNAFRDAGEAIDFIGTLLDASTEYSIVGTNLDGTILLWNQGARRLYGYEPHEIISRPEAVLHHEDDMAAGVHEAMLETALRDGKWEDTLQARRQDGSSFTARVVCTLRRGADGRPTGFLLISSDISDEVRLTRALEETQSYTRSLVESHVDALMATDPIGVISDVNEQMVALTGRSREELIGSPFKDYFTDPSRAEEGIKLTLSEGKVTNYELTARATDGRETVVSYNASTFTDRDGKLKGVFAAARDMTEHKRFDAQLRDQQTYLRGLIESSVDGLVTVDPEGAVLDVNERMCEMTGYSRSELLGTPFDGYFTDAERARAGVQETLDSGSFTDDALTLVSRTRRQLQVSLNTSVFRGQDGKVQGIFASARDVSGQFRLQSQLEEQQAYNRSLFEASADALFAIGPDGVVTDVNEAATRLTGYSRKRLVNSPFPEYFSDPDLARAGVGKTIEAGRTFSYDLVLVTRSGGRVTISLNAGVFSDAVGEPAGILASVRDITDQKRLEYQLIESQSYTRSLVESHVDALMATDPIGVISDVNEQMVALTGRSREELIGSPFKDYFTDPSRAEEGIKLTLSEGKVTNYELTARATDGRETVVSYNASTFTDRDGKLKGVFAAARDVTEHKRFEAQLQETNAALETANLAKDRFLARMSHELRTPLNAILGFTGTMLMELPGPLTADQKRQLETVKFNGRHLLSIINDLLDLAKIEAGKRELEFESIACKGLLESVVDGLRPLADEKGIGLHLRTPPGDVVVRSDRRSLNQILINLASNAIKFTDEGTVRLELDHRRDDGNLVTSFNVIDTGMGIKSEDHAKVFAAFEQVDPAATHRYAGTGLGLCISQRLANLIHGDIHFESEYGQGSTFVLDLSGQGAETSS